MLGYRLHDAFVEPSPCSAALRPSTESAQQGPSTPGIRVLPNARSQSSAHRIGRNVGRLRAQAFIATKRVIVVSRLPDRRVGINAPADGPSTPGLQDLHAASERSAPQLDQPMQMIRHDHPRQGACPARPLHSALRFYQQIDAGLIVEPAPTRVCHGGDRIDIAGLRPATNTKCGTGHAERLGCA